MNRSFKHVAALAIAAGAAQAGMAAEWSDTSMSIHYGTKYRFPGNPNDVAIGTVNLTHASAYSLGHNFFNVAILRSDGNDPAKGGGGGATEIYVVYRNQVMLGRVMDRSFEMGPVADWGFTFGFDVGTKNDEFAGSPFKWLLGPTVNFNVPGFLNFSVLYRGERGRNGLPFATFARVRYDDTWGVASSWGIPFSAGAPMVFKGFMEHTGKKGNDGFGAPTAAETMVDAALMLDAGSFAKTPQKFYVGVGYLYRKNIFGVPGVNERVPSLRAEVHF